MKKKSDAMRILYQERRNKRLCVQCAEPSRLAYCVDCARDREAKKLAPPRGTGKVVALYCGELLDVREVAKRIRKTPCYVRARLQAAGVARSQGIGIHDRYVAWVEEASRSGESWAARGRMVGVDGTRAKRVVQRWLDASRPWVLRAVEEHKKGRPWHEVAAAVGKDEEDTRTFVSRRVAYERRLKELSK